MRYLVCKDRRVLGPLEASDLVKLPNFQDSLVCPENLSGLNAADWRRPGAMPELRALVTPAPAPALPPAPAPDTPDPEAPPTRTVGFAPRPAADPHGSRAQRREALEEADTRVLAALERRIAMLEQTLSAEEELAEPAGLPPEPELDRSVGDLHARLASLEDMLQKTHHLSRSALTELEERTQKTLREMTAKLEELRAASEKKASAPPPPPPAPRAAAPASAPAAPPPQAVQRIDAQLQDLREAKPAPRAAADEEHRNDKLHHKAMHGLARLFGASELCREAADLKSAFGGALTALVGLATGATGVLGGIGHLLKEAQTIHGFQNWLDFIANLGHDHYVQAIAVSAAVFGTGLSQIGSANDNAALLDNHQELLDNHQELMDSHQKLMDSHAALHAKIDAQATADDENANAV